MLGKRTLARGCFANPLRRRCGAGCWGLATSSATRSRTPPAAARVAAPIRLAAFAPTSVRRRSSPPPASGSTAERPGAVPARAPRAEDHAAGPAQNAVARHLRYRLRPGDQGLRRAAREPRTYAHLDHAEDDAALRRAPRAWARAFGRGLERGRPAAATASRSPTSSSPSAAAPPSSVGSINRQKIAMLVSRKERCVR